MLLSIQANIEDSQNLDLNYCYSVFNSETTEYLKQHAHFMLSMKQTLPHSAVSCALLILYLVQETMECSTNWLTEDFPEEALSLY